MTEHEDNRIRTYLAIGDSFSEGLMDESALEDGRFIGWTDRLAHSLTQAPVGSPDLLYANHAIRGRQLTAIIDEQVPVALDLKPDLVSFVAGGNDVLRPSADVDGLAEQLERAISAMRAEGIEVLLGNGFDTAAFSPMLRTAPPRGRVQRTHVDPGRPPRLLHARSMGNAPALRAGILGARPHSPEHQGPPHGRPVRTDSARRKPRRLPRIPAAENLEAPARPHGKRSRMA